jgi:hypothetical protein
MNKLQNRDSSVIMTPVAQLNLGDTQTAGDKSVTIINKLPSISLLPFRWKVKLVVTAGLYIAWKYADGEIPDDRPEKGVARATCT